MGTKNKPGLFDCYANALPDEPMFHLLARDPQEPNIIEAWADGRAYLIDKGERPESDRAMIAEARECAETMRQWRAENNGKWRTRASEYLDRPARTEQLVDDVAHHETVYP